jgi:hypothetical protein
MFTVSLTPVVRQLLRTVAVAFAAASMLVIAASTAHAGFLEATCQGTVNSTFSPGLRLTNQSINGSDSSAFSCTSATDPTVTGGSTAQSYAATQSCLNPAASYPFSATIHWNNGATSTVSGISVLTALAGQSVYTVTGTVTAGQFNGDSVVYVTIEPALNLLECAFAPGVTSRSGTATLEVTGL